MDVFDNYYFIGIFNWYFSHSFFSFKMLSGSKPAWKTPPVTPNRPLHEILRSAQQGQRDKRHVDTASSSGSHRGYRSNDEEKEAESTTDVGRMANKLRTEAKLASSLFSGEDARKVSLTQLMDKSKQRSSKSRDAHEK